MANPTLCFTPVALEACGNIQQYKFDSLPKKFFKKYKHLRRLCDITRSKTPKVTIYSKLAKCTLFENASANRHCSGGFEAKFYKPESKCELTYEAPERTKLVFQVPNVCHFERIIANNQFEHQFSIDDLKKHVCEAIGVENEPNSAQIEGYYEQLRHAWEGRAEAQRKEAKLSESEAKNDGNCSQASFGYSCFPVIFGTRPNNPKTSASSTPLSTAPNSARYTNSSKSSKQQQQQHPPPNPPAATGTKFESLGSINPSEIHGYQVSPPQHRDGSMAIQTRLRSRAPSPQKRNPLQNSIGSIASSRQGGGTGGSFSTDPVQTMYGWVVQAEGRMKFMFNDGVVITKDHQTGEYAYTNSSLGVSDYKFDTINQPAEVKPYFRKLGLMLTEIQKRRR